MPLEPLPYAPPIEAEESLWSWITRVALYHGWLPDHFLLELGFAESKWESYFRHPDVDCAAPDDLIDRLAEVTEYSRTLLANHVIEPSPSTLWLDDRVAFCETCWSEDPTPYVRRSWLDAWCIDCPLHGCSLVTLPELKRPRRAADWNAAWSCRADWAEPTRATCTAEIRRSLMSTQHRIPRPVGAVDRAADLPPPSTDAAGSAAMNAVERRLVLLCGKAWGEWSIVRAYFNVENRLQWRNTDHGYDPQRPVLEPLGSLDLRSGAIRLGRAMFDILFDQPYREPRIADSLRSWMGGLFNRPRQWLMMELAAWPEPIVTRWKQKFEWCNELEWRRITPICHRPRATG